MIQEFQKVWNHVQIYKQVNVVWGPCNPLFIGKDGCNHLSILKYYSHSSEDSDYRRHYVVS